MSTFLVSYALGWGAVPWTLISELLPQHVRSVGCGLCAICYWLCAFVVTWQFANLSNWLGMHGVFWLFAGVCIVAAAFVKLAVPETKNFLLEQISDMFESAA